MQHKLIIPTGLLFFVFVLGLALRLVNLNWDQGQHLHPDERYLTMVANDIQWPNVKTSENPLENLYQNFKLYLSPQSPLSPYNYNNFKSFLYGTFPIFWVKAFATVVGWDDYGHLVIAGRFWSAIFSTATVFLVYLLARGICKKGPTFQKVGPFALLAAFFTAATVTLIQSAHFFTMESFLVFFSLLTIYFSYKVWESGKFRDFALAGVSLGFALACKISAVFLLGVVGLAVFSRVIGEIGEIREVGGVKGKMFWLTKNKDLCLLPIFSIALLLSTYLIFRLLQPYAFATANFFDFSLQPNFLANLKQQQAAIKGGFLYPPAYQWLLSAPFWSPLKNLVLWALGPALGVSGVLGVLLMTYEMIFNKKFHYSLMLSYILFLFFYVGGQFVNSIRYLITIVPLLNIAAAYFWVWVIGKLGRLGKFREFGIVGLGVTTILTLVWALTFTSIYTRKTTRVTASKWIYQNIPANAALANEHWDDPLPLALPSAECQNSKLKCQNFYEGVMLGVYNEDNPQKLIDLYQGLSKANYVILSSARASGSIGELPKQFPIMSKYYQFLDSGGLGFEKVAEITSYPQLFDIIINDASAEETFWVYDHPGVKIYRKTKELSWDEFFSLFP